MLTTYTVTFFGPQHINNPDKIKMLLEKLIDELLIKNKYVNFLVGRNGEFDQCVSSSVQRVRQNYNGYNSAITLILPYPTTEYLCNHAYFKKYYSEIEICHLSSIVPPKTAVQICHREMIDRSDLIVFYIENKSGRAYQNMRYASKQNKQLINLADTANNLEQ